MKVWERGVIASHIIPKTAFQGMRCYHVEWLQGTRKIQGPVRGYRKLSVMRKTIFTWRYMFKNMFIRMGGQVLYLNLLEQYSEHHQRNGQPKDFLPWGSKETQEKGTTAPGQDRIHHSMVSCRDTWPSLQPRHQEATAGTPGGDPHPPASLTAVSWVIRHYCPLSSF